MRALQKKGRVEQAGGMKFYEQDVVMLNYLYTEDVTVNVDVVYAMPGFGLVIKAYDRWAGAESVNGKKVVAKVGSMECSFYEKDAEQALLKKESCLLSPDGEKHHLVFRKSGTNLYVYEDKALLGRCAIGEDYDRYTLGIYSSAGNTVFRMDIKDSCPGSWGTSVQNTNGGRLSFTANGFKVENAENAAEVIQESILVPGGTDGKKRYFLSYKAVPVDGELHASCFVFPSKEPKIKAKEKNLLRYDKEKYGDAPYFDVDGDTEVTILFEVYSGEIKNVAIKEDWREDYVPSETEPRERSGSSLTVGLADVGCVTWLGHAEAIPVRKLDEEPTYGIIVYGKHGVSIDESHMEYNKDYRFRFKNNGDIWAFDIMDGDKTVCHESFVAGRPNFSIFSNVTGVIHDIEIEDLSGNKKSVMHQRTVHKSVPSDITSPIIVAGSDDVPFDLSASYRVLPDGSYYFTNWEREVFPVRQKLALARPALSDIDIVVYGLKEDGDMKKIYDVPDADHINSIDAVTERYDSISSDHFSLQKNQTIVLDDEISRKDYKGFIVDYLKQDSYAVNEKDGYEVTVSSKDNDTSTYYDLSESGEVHEYRVTGLSPADDSYIVLRKGEAE